MDELLSRLEFKEFESPHSCRAAWLYGMGRAMNIRFGQRNPRGRLTILKCHLGWLDDPAHRLVPLLRRFHCLSSKVNLGSPHHPSSNAPSFPRLSSPGDLFEQSVSLLWLASRSALLPRSTHLTAVAPGLQECPGIRLLGLGSTVQWLGRQRMGPFVSSSASSSQQVPCIVHGSGQGCSALVGVPPGGGILARSCLGTRGVVARDIEMRLCLEVWVCGFSRLTFSAFALACSFTTSLLCTWFCLVLPVCLR